MIDLKKFDYQRTKIHPFYFAILTSQPFVPGLMDIKSKIFVAKL